MEVFVLVSFPAVVVVLEELYSSSLLPLRDTAGVCLATFLMPSYAQKGKLSLFSLLCVSLFL